MDGETVEWVKGLLCKHEHLSLDAQHPHKGQMQQCMYHSSRARGQSTGSSSEFPGPVDLAETEALEILFPIKEIKYKRETPDAGL